MGVVVHEASNLARITDWVLNLYRQSKKSVSIIPKQIFIVQRIAVTKKVERELGKGSRVV